MLGVESMAKTKRGRPKKAEPSPEERVVIAHLKGTRAYADWLEAFRRDTGLPKVTIIRFGLIEMAKKHGRPTPPEM
jgi:hypothetical protein